jgi:endonuclease/exonuclease/phosphatase family metal-dependent hydrolase
MKLGTMGLMANKGAVSVSFSLGDHELLLINCHLEAHEENRQRRNDQWNDIADNWCLGEDVAGKMTTRMRTKRRIDKKWDAIIWMGDFNSRVEDFSLPHPKTN